MKGKFITFEGGEGSGKTTVIKSVERHLKDKSLPVIVTREPGSTTLGEKIRLLLLEEKGTGFYSKRAELALFLAARSQHVEEVIIPSLKKGYIVLCDRYNDSSLAYQGYARDLGMEEVKKMCDFFSLKQNPDLTIYLDLPSKIGLDRILKNSRSDTFDRIESEKSHFHEKVRKGFKKIAENEPDRFKIVNADQSKEDVFKETIHFIDLIL